jgi:hypothetical protein
MILGVAVCTVGMAQKKYLTTHFPNSTLMNIVKDAAPGTYAPVYGDQYWQDSIPEAMRKSYIAKGEQLLNCKWESLPVTLFSDYRTNGDRMRYQNVIFPKRNQLITLVLAELMEHKGRFMPDILNGLLSICEETWWGIPAHYGPKMPVPEQQSLDLFNAETGGMMSWVYYMMKEPISQFSPLLTQRIKQEITRRILVPGLNGNDWWRTSAMNWNPWICSNWLTCVLLVEDNKANQAQGLEKIFGCLDYYMDNYSNDGGCDEGPSYWDRSAASMCDCLWLLSKATGGKIDMSSNPKLKAMGAYLCKMNIGKRHGVNFADAGPGFLPSVNSVFTVGTYLHDKVMCSYSAYLAKEEDFFTDPAKRCSYLFPLSRELMLLSQIKTLESYKGKSQMYFDAYLPDLQVVTARSEKNSEEGLFMAAKGGTNGESHNHNDVGNFIVYQDAEPMIIDAGVGTYRRETFNDATRYKIWTMQSGYHNLPQINGVDQMYGKTYAAKDVKEKATNKRVTFSLDIAGAYPEEAKVKSWVRTLNFVRGKYVDVTEQYALSAYTAPTEIMLITPVKPTVSDGKVSMKSDKIHAKVTFNPAEVEVSAEEINMDDEKMTHTWGHLYRIKMRVKSTGVNNLVRYRISGE